MSARALLPSCPSHFHFLRWTRLPWPGASLRSAGAAGFTGALPNEVLATYSGELNWASKFLSGVRRQATGYLAGGQDES